MYVGNYDDSPGTGYAQIFNKYLTDNESLFVISSDFCHWGNSYIDSEGLIYEALKILLWTIHFDDLFFSTK